MPTVSVIIPAYNYAEFVGAAIESAVAQTHTDTEIIVVDDGSTDDTPAVLDRFASRVTVLRQANRGLAAARNTGIRAASGAYVALLDADDVWEPAFLELSVHQLAAADESTVGVFSGWVMTDRSGRILPGTQRVRRGAFGIRDFLHVSPFPPSTVTLRRAAVCAAGGFDEAQRATEDWDLWLRLTAAGGSFAALERCLCRYRAHGQNMSHDPDAMRTGALRSLEKLFAGSALAPDLRAERAAAFAHVHARASAQLYAARRGEDGARALGEAVRLWPDILLEDETHWAIICAEQPVGYKGSAEFLDLGLGEGRILSALGSCVGAADPHLQRRARGRAYRALAQLAYGQRHMAAVRRYVRCAAAADPGLWSDGGMVATFVKSLAGAAAVDRLGHWKRRLSGRP